MTIDEKLEAWRNGLIPFASKTLVHFVMSVFPDYLMGWVHFEICQKLDKFLKDIDDGKNPRLIITLPPRSGKSQIVSRAFPAYALGRDPDTSIISCSYSSDLVNRFSRDVQRIMDSDVYRKIFPDVELSKGSSAGKYSRTVDFFQTVGHEGSYRAAGIGSGITGMGAKIFIIDDFVKDRAEAASPVKRDAVWDWYTSTAYTRLAPKSGMIVMATRWNCDDLIGRLIEAMRTGDGDQFEVINYPAIATHDEEHRKTGEALHPDRYPLDKLLKIKSVIGNRDWEAMYQQHPIPDGGAVFKSDWLRYWTPESLPLRFDNVILSWDMAFKGSAKNDFVVGQAWGRHGANFYLLDQFRGQWDFVKTRQMFILMAQKYPHATAKLIEDKANGTAIITELQKAISGIVPVNPTESKEARAYAVTPYFEAGNVYLPAEASWRGDYETELLSFPNAAHDDCVDSTTQSLSYFMKHQPLTLSKETMQKLKTPPRSFYRI